MKWYAYIFSFLISASLALSQQFDTHIVNLNGELSEDDNYEESIGRFDAYEMKLGKGDYIKINLKAEFFPLLTVVSPSGKYNIAYPQDNNLEVIHGQKIDETGHWYIYVSGDKTDVGKHEMNIYYVSENSRDLPAQTDICTITNFVLAHSNTNFFYFTDWDVFAESQEIFKNTSRSSNGNISSFVLETDEMVSKNKFDEWSYQISECLGYDWEEKGSNNKIRFNEINGDRSIELIYDNEKIKLVISTKIK
ncbi:MAG: hypothetical protein ABFS12_04230 [Bacteroidota bacterium]